MQYAYILVIESLSNHCPMCANRPTGRTFLLNCGMWLQSALHPCVGGGGVKVQFLVKPDLACNLGLLCILGFTISIPVRRYYLVMHLQYSECGMRTVFTNCFYFISFVKALLLTLTGILLVAFHKALGLVFLIVYPICRRLSCPKKYFLPKLLLLNSLPRLIA